VFVRNGTNWIQQAYLKPSNPESFDRFGESVVVSDDKVVIDARMEDSNATGVNGDQSNNSAADSVAAYVFGPPCRQSPC
jgi:trimeric autotransporter adhesin